MDKSDLRRNRSVEIGVRRSPIATITRFDSQSFSGVELEIQLSVFTKFEASSSPASLLLQPLHGDANIEPFDLCVTPDAKPINSLEPALRTPYAAPQILYTISGVYTSHEWNHELVLARIEASKRSPTRNVSSPSICF